MTKKHFLILAIAVTIIGGLVLSSNIANATVVQRVCHNGPNNNDSGGCGTPCMALCRDTNFVDSTGRAACETVARGTDSWIKYDATSKQFEEVSPRPHPPPPPCPPLRPCPLPLPPSPIWRWDFNFIRWRGIPAMETPEIRIAGTSIAGTLSTGVFTTGMSIASTPAIDIAAVCSTADKCNADTCDAAADIREGPRRGSLLRSGNCRCGPGEVGGVYKICCRREGNSYVETAARSFHTQDRHLPEEGHCRGARTAWSQRSEDAHPGLSGHLVVRGEGTSLTCTPIDAPTEFRIDSFLANPTTITPGQSTTLTWATTGAIDCRITRTGGAGLGNVPPDGSGQSNPPATTTYTLNCGREGNITERRSISATVTVAPAAQRWWFCVGDTCQQTTEQFTAATDCQEAVRRHRGITANCYRTRNECEQGCGAQRWWFCMNNVCRQTTEQYTTAAACQAAVRTWHRIDVTCHRTEGDCRPACLYPPPPPSDQEPTPIISAHNDVHINNFSVSPTCIPQQPTNRREATLSWNVSIRNSCPALPDNPDVSIPVTSDGRCAPASWTSGWTLTSPTSYEASCTAYGGWSGSRSLVGSHSISPSPSSTTTYGLSCSRTDTYTCQYARSYSFQSWGCVRWESYQSCTTTGRPPRRVCVWRSRCIREGCISGSGSVFGSGPVFGPSSSSRETTLAVVQPLDRVDLEPEKDRILHKTFTNISWSSSAPSSSTPNRNVTTGIQCTPSVQTNGDGTGWTGPINSLDSSGTRRISPRRTTTYQLLCRNIYQNNQACYTYRSATQIIRVFDPDLREVPAFYDGFMRLVGRIGNALR